MWRGGRIPPTKGCLRAPSLYINSGVHPYSINQSQSLFQQWTPESQTVTVCIDWLWTCHRWSDGGSADQSIRWSETSRNVLSSQVLAVHTSKCADCHVDVLPKSCDSASQRMINYRKSMTVTWRHKCTLLSRRKSKVYDGHVGFKHLVPHVNDALTDSATESFFFYFLFIFIF
jgi:hypothetical protein